jgi:hypothetical protein
MVLQKALQQFGPAKGLSQFGPAKGLCTPRSWGAGLFSMALVQKEGSCFLSKHTLPDLESLVAKRHVSAVAWLFRQPYKDYKSCERA